MLYVLDAVLNAIDHSIATHEPERGGALLGPAGRAVITSFVFDDEAEATRTTYKPSRALAEYVHELESERTLEFKGIVHSHPGGFDRPSFQDERELETGLSLNPHLALYAAPIVTQSIDGSQLSDHELPLSVDSKISFFTATRIREGNILVEEKSVKNVPLHKHLVDVSHHFEAEQESDIELISQQLSGVDVLAGRITFPGDFELLILTSELYPDVPPIVLATQAGETRQLQVKWDLELPPDRRLLEGIASVVAGKPPFSFGYGPRPNLLLTDDPERAAAAHWQAGFSGYAPSAQSEAVRQGLFARSKGLLSDDLTNSRVLIFGAGSVGSVLAEELARSGVGEISIVDPELVEAANISRTVYEAADIGVAKPAALARHLLQINPTLEAKALESAVQEIDKEELEETVRNASLVIAATDDPDAQLRVNRHAYRQGTPALYVGLTAGANGGEVVMVVPEETPCYLCATVIRHEAPGADQLAPDVDYGTGRLKGEIALGCDIHHVTTAATKLALSLLVKDKETSLSTFAPAAVDEQQTYLTMSMVPDYWMYPQLFESVKGQYSHQSVWLTPSRRPACPICGSSRADDGEIQEEKKLSLDAVRAAAPNPHSPVQEEENDV